MPNGIDNKTRQRSECFQANHSNSCPTLLNDASQYVTRPEIIEILVPGKHVESSAKSLSGLVSYFGIYSSSMAGILLKCRVLSSEPTKSFTKLAGQLANRFPLRGSHRDFPWFRIKGLDEFPRVPLVFIRYVLRILIFRTLSCDEISFSYGNNQLSVCVGRQNLVPKMGTSS